VFDLLGRDSQEFAIPGLYAVAGVVGRQQLSCVLPNGSIPRRPGMMVTGRRIVSVTARVWGMTVAADRSIGVTVRYTSLVSTSGHTPWFRPLTHSA
jgi:hypothetical protein